MKTRAENYENKKVNGMQLEVGDKVSAQRAGCVNVIYPITRVTKTQAISETNGTVIRFAIDLRDWTIVESDNSLNVLTYGGTKYSNNRTTFVLCSAEDIEEREYQRKMIALQSRLKALAENNIVSHRGTRRGIDCEALSAALSIVEEQLKESQI